jgi:hypothetical protein
VQETTVARPAKRPAWLIDSADFWRLWFVGLVVFVVRWVETVAVGVFVYQQTGSPFIVAMMTMLRLLPMGLFGAFLGAIAERMERRTTLIVVVLSMVITSLTLATLAHLHLLAVWHLALASFINGIGWATDNPVRRVMIGEAVGASQMGTAMSVDIAGLHPNPVAVYDRCRTQGERNCPRSATAASNSTSIGCSATPASPPISRRRRRAAAASIAS